ncbi:secreted protein-like protein [Leptotrombidium deliense]|uniref:Secreted protein-like protein n=1 Tax=Leptotrombidium deliense TaxID=299467 RepID=A0A443RXB5_9ACAR|nr:secreted protein-like protein [Leptotrombidium deliense]
MRFLMFNKVLEPYCPSSKQKCPVQIMQKLCRSSKIHLIKTTGLTLKQVFKFVETLNNPASVKIVHLVRGPRAIYNSRRKLNLCMVMIVVKYEHVALDTYNYAGKLNRSLNIEFTDNVTKFIRNHTSLPANVSDTDPYSTIKDSIKIPSKWTTELTVSKMKDVQNSCTEVLQT